MVKFYEVLSFFFPPKMKKQHLMFFKKRPCFGHIFVLVFMDMFLCLLKIKKFLFSLLDSNGIFEICAVLELLLFLI